LMPDKGVIFSDGIAADHMKFNSGAIATIGLGKEKARLVLATKKDPALSAVEPAR